MIVFLIALVACVMLFVGGLLAPQLSKKPQYWIDKLLAKAAGTTSHAPGPLRKVNSAAARKVGEADQQERPRRAQDPV